MQTDIRICVFTETFMIKYNSPRETGNLSSILQKEVVVDKTLLCILIYIWAQQVN